MNSRLKIYVEATPLLDDRLSGIGHSLQSILQALDAKNIAGEFRIILVAPFDKMSRLKKRTRSLNVKYKAIPLPARGLYLLWKYNLVPPLDLILGKGVYIFPNFRNWRLVYSKSITFVHDIVHEISPEFVSPPNQRFLHRNMPKWLRQADKIIAVSKNTKQDLIRIYNCSSQKIEVVYNGVDLEKYFPQPEAAIKKVTSKYALPKNYIMFLSTVEPRKNLTGLLDAYKLLPEKIRRRYALLIVGSAGWLVEDTVRRIAQMQSEGYNLIWPRQYVPDGDLPALLSGATALVHPAHYEGFGISPLQAMACGTPVIVSKNSSLPEVVGHGAIYIDPNDSAEIASSIERLISDTNSQAKLAAGGRRRASEFSWSRSVERLLEIIIKESK